MYRRRKASASRIATSITPCSSQGWGRSSACGICAKPSTTISAASISPESASLRLDRRAASSPSKWNGAAPTWWPSSSRKTSAGTSCRFRRRSLPRSGRSRSPACRASRTASGSITRQTNRRRVLIHADIYNLPEIGEFDVAVLASVLLHCQCPAKIISQCAKRCRSILITELYYPEMTGAVCELLPTQENEAWHTWWRLRPGFLYPLSRRDRLRRHEGDVPRAPAHAGAGAHVPDVLGRGVADLASVRT